MAETQHRYPIITNTGTVDNATTAADTYATAGELSCRLFKTKHVVNQATTNNLMVTILGSVDGGVTFPVTATAEFTVTVGTPTTNTITTYFTHLRIRVKPAGAGNNGTLATQWAAASF